MNLKGSMSAGTVVVLFHYRKCMKVKYKHYVSWGAIFVGLVQYKVWTRLVK